jgi:hypothetical protein
MACKRMGITGLIKMTPSKHCQQLGLKSLANLSKITNVPRRTLSDWFYSKPELFDIICKGCLVKTNKEGDL